MWAAGALRGSPASTTITPRRWRASWRAPARPAAEPPTTATSVWRRTAGGRCSWGSWWAMAATVRWTLRTAIPLAGSARTRGGAVADDVEQVVRQRLRALRTTLGLSLDELAARTHLSPSTISRVETGKRTISLDVLVPLATALQVDLDALLDVRVDDDVVIRPHADTAGHVTTWL